MSVQQAAISQPLVAAKANEPLPENIYFADLDKFYPANNAAELRPHTQKSKTAGLVTSPAAVNCIS